MAPRLLLICGPMICVWACAMHWMRPDFGVPMCGVGWVLFLLLLCVREIGWFEALDSPPMEASAHGRRFAFDGTT